MYIKRTMDGTVPKDNSQGCIIENSCFLEIRDDVIQDDSQNDFTFRGCYLQGHVIFSWRPGGKSPAGKSGRIMTVENCLIHLDRMMYLGEDTYGDAGSKRADKYVSPNNATTPSSPYRPQYWAASGSTRPIRPVMPVDSNPL